MFQERLRNLGIVAHIDAGKTTVSERILFYSGLERRMGEVHEGNATMDWMEEERRRGITITAACTTVPWNEHTINLIDTPGHVDFTVEVERCMRVLDGAVLVINGVSGVQAQSETVWRQMQRHHVAALAFVNQLDRPGADFLHAVGDLNRRLGVRAIPIQYPLGSERAFRAVVDLVSGKALRFPAESLGRDPLETEVPAEARDEVEVLRAELVEILAEEDEALMEAFLEEGAPDPALLKRALRRRVLEGSLLPVLAGAALRNVGVQGLLDAVVDYLPSPLDVPPMEGVDARSGERVRRRAEADQPVACLAFKLQADPNEDLLFTRVYSGEVRPGQKLYNPRVGRMERIARVLRMHADTRTALEVAGPGEIVALTGCKLTGTGDTLCTHDEALLLERPVFPEPVLTRAVEPASTAEADKLRAALERLQFEDPSFRVREDEETGQWLIQGMGELHLEIKEHRLRDEFHTAVRVGQPRVAYRESPTRPARARSTVDRVLGGNRIFGALELAVQPPSTQGASGGALAPSAAGDGSVPAPLVQVVWADDCPVPPPFRQAVAETLLLEAQVGPRFGFPMRGLTVEVVGGESHPERDAELGFCQAASMALREALQSAAVAVLEPVMAFEIEAPEEFMSGIIGQLNAKGAEISDVSVDQGTRRVEGTVPLYTMFGYASLLRSLSQGRASFSLMPAGFRAVPEEELGERGLVWK